MKFYIVLFLFIIQTAANWLCAQENLNISFNQSFIESHQTKINLNVNNKLQIFSAVFESLPDSVFVFPTENYYYFNFVADAVNYHGNIGLFRQLIQKNRINFSYYTNHNLSVGADRNHIELGPSEGLAISHISTFVISIEYNSKIVIFNLNEMNFSTLNEIYYEPNEESIVCPVFDESGYSFILIFNNDIKSFFWMLDNRSSIPDSLIKIDENIFKGINSEFIFYRDSILNRYLLFGVKSENVYQNNWYDGPFDQIPDNHIYLGHFDFKKFLTQAYPKFDFDFYGGFKDDKDSRIAISNYYLYSDYNDIIILIKKYIKNRDEVIKSLCAQNY